MAHLMAAGDARTGPWAITKQNLDRELEYFVVRVPYVTYLVAVSADGLLLARSGTLPPDMADHLAAIAAGLVSLLNGAARSMHAEPVTYNLTEMRDGYMFSMAVPCGASLLALATRGCDIGRVGQEMADLINRVGQALNPPHRNGAASHAPGVDW